ncbi:hemerythrin [Anaerocolumna cellulosilytica]|uniref:Hemerythrin n=1 Tax=Anaerocolumna cellulosilytica TaxID=433286 RepID=A0A6S6R1E5_9FIRM|nr:hemerythrin domain-containing protein [Anaerocolumna cellulosilytica]MBB5195363.1 hemerythrin-like domain-containing protein [Anaerocolumna cellulosilytica]BCJ95896.1 hemerythrin [Anaerocolumna cellulosilytica]
MNSIEIMIEEHKYIKRMLAVVRKACYGILKGEPINYEHFEEMIDFIRSYADQHHHGKEEKLLFKEMQTHLGKIGENLITHGMLVEHDFGRLYIADLVDALKRVQEGDEESKLDVIANAVGYTHLLTRHIAKEDEVVYTFGGKQLPPEVLTEVNEKTDEFEEVARVKGIQDKYITLVNKLEKEYGI